MKKRLPLFLLSSIFLFFASSAFATEHVVSQKNKKFSVDTLKVKFGDTIKFVNNEEDITHNVYSESTGYKFDLRTQDPGKFSIVEIDKVAKNRKSGVMNVECAIHPNMKLKVEIVGD